MPAAQAVEALIQEYGQLVFHTIYALTGDWEESQDLTQDTFHQALKAIDAARADREARGEQFYAKAWLLRIALNTVRMQRRRRYLFRFIPFSSMRSKAQTEDVGSEESADEELQAQAAPVQPVGYGATRNDDPARLVAERDAVQRTMARLSEPLRICLLLSIVGDFSTAEIADMLDLQEAAVRQRLARARKQFQQIYALESNEQPDSGTPAPVSTARGISARAEHRQATISQKHEHEEERVESRATGIQPPQPRFELRTSTLGRTYA
jgi:RNA polymerase sigma-70 factor (ECF subfamily)